MRDLTVEELDLEFAEQLPARELMSGAPCYNPCKPSLHVKVVLIVAIGFGGKHPA